MSVVGWLLSAPLDAEREYLGIDTNYHTAPWARPVTGLDHQIILELATLQIFLARVATTNIFE